MSSGLSPSSFISLRITRFWLLYLLGIAKVIPFRSFRLFTCVRSDRTITVDPSRWPRYAIFTFTPCSRSFIASGAIMKLACSRPLFIVSTTVGKSVKRWDSKRVDGLVFDAKSVTGHVRWQVTGRKPTARVSRGAAFCATVAAVSGRCHGLLRSTPNTTRSNSAPRLQRTSGERIIGRSPCRARRRRSDSASSSRPRSVRILCTAATTSGCVVARGRGTLRRTSLRMRAGRSLSTSTRSASCAASSMSWVTSTTVRGCSRSRRASSARSFSRVR